MYVAIIIVAIMDVLVGFVFLGILRPLVQRKIGRNGFCGFRTRETLASDKAWYAVNYGAAKTAVYMSIGMIVFGIILALLPSIVSDHTEDTALIAGGTAPLVFVLGLIVATNIELKKLDKSDTGEML
jgi:SdpI/YfhL protein family